MILYKKPLMYVKSTLNYQYNCRNTLHLIVALSYGTVNLDILIISLVCTW